MKNRFINNLLPHVVAVLIFITLSAIFFSPQLKGYVLHQTDLLQAQGMSKEVLDFREKTGEESLWTNSAFGGMPTYQIYAKYTNLMNSLKNFLNRIIPRPLGYMFYLMLGFYVMLLCFNINPWLAIIGAVGFGLSSLNILYLGAGHNAKINAIMFIPPIFGGLYYAYKKNHLTGSAIIGLFISLHLAANHFQMTYYMLFLILAFFVVELYDHFKNELLPKFIRTSSIILIVGIIGVLPAFSNLLLTYEYSKFTTRGKSELTISSEQNSNPKDESKALDRDYIKQYSMGFGEIWNIVIPNIKGGKMGYIGQNEKAMEVVSPNYRQTVAQQSTYWGEQYASGGALYFGASIFLLFLLGIFFVKDKIKWTLLTVSLLAVFLSWKYSGLTDWFIDNFPLYSKFRDTKMMLILAQLSFPLLGFLFLNKLIKGEQIDRKKFLYISGGLAGLFFLFYIMPTLWFDFFNRNEINQFNKLLGNYKGNPNAISQIKDLKVEIVDARVEIFRQDVLRSLFFVVATTIIVYLFVLKKIKRNGFLIVLGLLILIDLWFVGRRYLNDDNFQSKQETKVLFPMTQADKHILQDNDPNFRVFNLTVDPFSDASTSYYHKSIGGYHGAKLKRYQELIEFHISKNNIEVLNMLNTKYFIVFDDNRQAVPQYNPEAMGNAWFVDDYRIVSGANEEMLALNGFNPEMEAIIDVRYEDFVAGKSFTKDTLSSIKLESYKPNHLTYSAKSYEEELAVFSEIYYPEGWNVFIDGKPANHFRVNYILRAMVIPEGEHTIEFKFEPKSYYIGNKVSLISSILLILFIVFVFGKEIFEAYIKRKNS